MIKKSINTLSAAEAYRKTERYEAAVEELDAASELFITATGIVASVCPRVNEIDFELLDSSAMSYARIKEIHNNLCGLVSIYRLYTSATVPYYKGLDIYWTAVEAYNQGEYKKVDAGFNQASNKFNKSKSRSLNAESEVPASARTTFIRRTCMADSMYHSSEHFIEASFAAQEDDMERASDYLDQAIVARDQGCGV